MSSKPNRLRETRYLFTFRDFRLLLAGRFFVTVAVQIQTVVVAWQIYDLTGDEFALGLIGLTEAIPSIGIALYAGHIADRLPRRSIVLTCIALLFICSLGFVTLSLDAPVRSDTLRVYLLYAVIFITGIGRGFYVPAVFSLMAQVVPESLYPVSTSWRSASWQLAAMGGPALGGMLYGYTGITNAFIASTGMLAISIGLFYLTDRHPMPEPDHTESLYESIRSGIAFVFQKRAMLGTITLDLFAVLFGGAVALLPVYARDILFVGPEGLGILRAAPAVGAFAMAIVLSIFPPVKKTGPLFLFSVAAFGVCMLVFAVSTSFYLSLVLLALSGAFDNISVVVRSLTIQALTPDHMRGKVSSVNSIFVGSSNEIGAFESGLAADLMGTVPSVVFGAIMTQVSVVATLILFPSLRHLSFENLKNSEDNRNE